MTKHTPKPWEAERYDTGRGQDASRFVCASKAPPGDRLIAACYGSRRVANAKLIAAAPMLLEALRFAVRALTGQPNPVECSDDHWIESGLEAARSAIREAGEE